MTSPISSSTLSRIDRIHSLIAADANDRGMKNLIVEGDFAEAAKHFARLPLTKKPNPPTVVILSGFPCLVHHDPPTETDGPNGSMALAYCAASLGYRVVIFTDACNARVFGAALDALLRAVPCIGASIELKCVSSRVTGREEEEMNELSRADLMMACERAGPARDGRCRTMTGVDMNSHDLIAPLHKLVEMRRTDVKFVGIGDGGNELGMGKVFDRVVQHIPLGETIGCVVEADYLIAASVSNWGAYALCGAADLIRAEDDMESRSREEWVRKCLVTEEADLAILKACMEAGCRDGINQRMDEPFVDGMPVERSLERGIWDVALEK